MSEWADLRILLEHTGALGGCRRKQEVAGENRRLGEGSGLLQEEGMGPHNGSKLSSGAFPDSQEG